MTEDIIEKHSPGNSSSRKKHEDCSLKSSMSGETADLRENEIDASFIQNLQTINIQPDISVIPKAPGSDDLNNETETEDKKTIADKIVKTITISSFSPDMSTTNKIVNTKYTKYNFLFYVTCQQFKFASSIYFFFIMVLQFKKELAVSSVASSVIPFLFVLFVSMINEGVDDYNRHKRDKLCNSGEYQKLVVAKTVKKTCMPSEMSPSKSIVVNISEEAKAATKPLDTPLMRRKSPQGSRSDINLPYAMGSNMSVNSSMNNHSVGSVVFPYVTTSVTSANIKTGDIILIKKGERVPADCILLKSTENSGEVFIRTDQLDGETDWKRREVISRSIDVEDELITRVEEPNKEIYEFTGILEYKCEGYDGKIESNSEKAADLSPPAKAVSSPMSKASTITVPVEVDNTIWADTVISTCDVLAIVIYTGNNTKSKQNTYAPRSKFGIIDKELDFFVIILAMFSAMFSLGFTFLRSRNLQLNNTGIIFLRFLILFSYVIPISLKVTINFARFIYTRNLQPDILIRTSSIQEELGRISYVLSDKTGTLTKNEMELKKLHLGTVLYDESNFGDIKTSIRNSIGQKIKSQLHPSDLDKNGEINLTHKLDNVVSSVLEALSTCHNVTPVDTEDGISYQASSPDEIAIVKYTESSGVKLISRDRNTMTIEYDLRSDSNFEEDQHILFHGFLRKTYKIHHIFPFSSDTKRMGIILSLIKEELLDLVSKSESLEFTDFPVSKEKEYLFFMKGADSIMKQIVKENDWVEEETDEMARYGLRTLIVGRKVLTKAQFKQFDKEYSAAKLSIKNRSENVLKVQKRLENGTLFSSDNSIPQPLDLLGLTGVEDKLQDNVRETLESLRVSGIKIWMLTGDKIETAISIAKSSRLLQNEDKTMVIKDCINKFQVERELEILKKQSYNSLVIDGASISTILQNDMPLQGFSLLHQFIDATKDLVAVIGCRYTPTQKATMAETLKRISKETVLCIGDGGNDVSMITEADVGVGIEGKEGNQASLAADFSLKKFCLLTDLLFVHGRKCYKNSSSLAHIIIHRGTILSVVQGVFCALIYHIPISILQRRLPSLFICFTFVPLLSIMHSKDINDQTAKAYPELYLELRGKQLLSIKEFVSSNLNSFFQGAVMVIILKLFLAEFHLFSICAFVSLVLNEFLMIFLTLERPTLKGVSIILGSMVFFILTAPFFDELRIERGFFSQNIAMILCVIMVAILPKICIKMYRLWLRPDSHLKIPE